MSLFRRSMLRPRALEDSTVVRLLESLSDDLAPEPTFQRRLRDNMVDLHRREIEASRARRWAPLRLVARAALMATVAVGATVGGVLGASQVAVPGDLLYPVKLEVEALRLRVLPTAMQPTLARAALAARIDELRQLAVRGEWERAAAMAGPIDVELARLASFGLDPTSGDSGLASELAQLASMVWTLPAEGASAVTEALGDAAELLGAPDTGSSDGAGNDGGDDSGGNNGNDPDSSSGHGSDGNNGNGSDSNGGNGNGPDSNSGHGSDGNNGNGSDGNNGNGPDDNNGNGGGSSGNGSDGNNGSNNGNGGGSSGNGSDGNNGNGPDDNNGNGGGNGKGGGNGNGN